ncbi:MAG: Co2+/Mg2+ efflux protein ApaG [Burkholderiales bacterium]|jgi:ApaG protein|nr:Co2+/Mg2+ efflux protein ApaG [Burkholderiales bacterium]NBO75887.1 Co2+/Mg2+ efflux protein ApaG [Betaproteobacteria bacterium]
MSTSQASGQFSCSVKVQHLPDQSDPQQGVHAYAYTVTIVNTGDITAQLVARRWLITNGHGQTEEVRGLAVVGHQPVLRPGEQFEYTSWVRLETPMGTMRGTFYCMTEHAQPFEAPVSEFMLAPPQALH